MYGQFVGIGIEMKKSKVGRCQCCNNALTENSHLVFGDEGRNFNIATLLFNYIKKALNESDGLKYAICDPCWQQLIQYNEFQQKCIRANAIASDEEEVDELDNDEDEVEKDVENMKKENDSTMTLGVGTQNETGGIYANGESQAVNNFQYECEYDEELDDMQIEYLDENDVLDEENWCTQEENAEQAASNDALKKIAFDFTPVLVKPIFMLGIGKSFDFLSFCDFISK